MEKRAFCEWSGWTTAKIEWSGWMLACYYKIIGFYINGNPLIYGLKMN
jgi:hypothetical protein